jgi:hypothetical protein
LPVLPLDSVFSKVGIVPAVYITGDGTETERNHHKHHKHKQEDETMFNKLHEAFIKDREAQRAANLFYINHGYMSTWSEENQKSSDPDNGIRRYSTETSWNNYKAGLITRERAAELATRRMNNEINKSIKEGTAELQAAYDAEDIDRIDISVSWKRNRTWGANPTAEVYANGWTTGTASG